MFDGKYAYRFTGFSVRYNVPWHLVGVGTMLIEGETIKGFHSASTTPMQGHDADLQLGRYKLAGTWKKTDHEDEFEATINFVHAENDANGDPKQKLEATFAFVRAGDRDGFWLISKNTFNTTKPGTKKKAIELVSGEAFRLKGS